MSDFDIGIHMSLEFEELTRDRVRFRRTSENRQSQRQRSRNLKFLGKSYRSKARLPLLSTFRQV